VRWRDCIEAIIEKAGDVTFVETGPNSILTGLFGRKWRAPRRFATDYAEDSAGLDALIEELSSGSGRAADAH
jgi:malonyl CoA-acyl carrier protein transacylase